MAHPGAPLLGRIRRGPAARRLVPLLLLVVAAGGTAAAGGLAVQTVEVNLIVDGLRPAPVVRARLQGTVETVGQRLLLGRPIDQLRPAQGQLQTTLVQVVGRVVTGYSVIEARIEVGPTATVAVRLRPEPPLIQTVELVPRVAVDPAVAPLVRGPLEGVGVEARTLFLGLPVDALDWAAPLLVEEVRRAVERTLPGFTAAVRARPAAALQLEAEVAPREDRLVRDIGVRFRSSSIPLLILDQHAPAVISMAAPLRGLPVVFAARYREDLERLLAARLRAYEPVVAYRIVTRPLLSVAETTYVTVLADSLLYQGWVEAAVNVGTRAPGPELRVHLGRLAGRFEFYGEIALTPSTLSLWYDAGVRYQVTGALDVGTSVRLNDLEASPWAAYRFTPDLSARAAYGVKQRVFEASVRYRFSPYLSAEVVGTSRGDYWLRVISNL